MLLMVVYPSQGGGFLLSGASPKNAMNATSRALVLAAKNPELFGYWAEMDTYWASLRSVIHPPEKRLQLWLIDPYRCAW